MLRKKETFPVSEVEQSLLFVATEFVLQLLLVNVSNNKLNHL